VTNTKVSVCRSLLLSEKEFLDSFRLGQTLELVDGQKGLAATGATFSFNKPFLDATVMENMITLCIWRPGNKVSNFKGVHADGAFLFLVGRNRTTLQVGTDSIGGPRPMLQLLGDISASIQINKSLFTHFVVWFYPSADKPGLNLRVSHCLSLVLPQCNDWRGSC
jgi:hypothetical protein